MSNNKGRLLLLKSKENCVIKYLFLSYAITTKNVKRGEYYGVSN